MNKHVFLIVSLISLWSAPAPAHEILLNTGDGLLRNCKMDSDPSEIEREHHLGLCLGFIKGVANALAMDGKMTICPPSTVDNEDLLSAFVTRAEKLPAKALGEVPSAMLVKVTYEIAFPCPAK